MRGPRPIDTGRAGPGPTDESAWILGRGRGAGGDGRETPAVGVAYNGTGLDPQ